MKLIVNGATVNNALSFPKTSSSTTFSNTTASVNLVGGNNTIRLETTASSATADIDWLEITGLSPAAGNCAGARLSSEMVSSGKGTMKGMEEEELSTPNQTLVFPNPAKGSLNISVTSVASEKVMLTLTAADGKAVHEPVRMACIRGVNRHSMDVLNLRAGNYYLLIAHEDGMREVKKVTIL